MTASLYRKYNAFSNRESAQTEQKHRTMTFVGLPDHVYFYLLWFDARQSMTQRFDTPI